MAKSITINSEDWHSANLSEETAKIIDKCVDDNYNVTLGAPGRFYLKDPSEDNINIIFSSNYIMSKDGVCLCENRQMINSIIDATVRYNNSTFRVNLNTSVEYYNGIGVFAENVSRNSSRICIAKAIFPNTIVFAIEPDTYNIENNIESILKTLLPFAMITSEEEWNMQMLKHHRDNIAEIMMTPYINKKQNIMQEISAKNSAIEKCHANIRRYTEELGELEEEIKNLVHKNELDDCVDFLGKRNDCNELYQAMDVFVFPSFKEGLPVTLIEAQATKLPCLISDTVSEYARQNSNVEYISLSASAAEWAQKAQKLASINRENVSCDKLIENYDIKETAKQLEKIYEG